MGLSRAAADVTDLEAVRDAIAKSSPTVVVNAAAFTGVDEAEDEREEARRVNEDGPRNLARACAKARLPLIHVSTDYVFDGRKGTSYREDDAVAPLNHYGVTKWRGEEAVRGELGEHLILRTSWLYGPYGRNFASRMIALASERESIQAAADQSASPTSASDLAKAIGVAAEAIGEGSAAWGTFHVAGRGSASRYDVAAAVIETQAHFTGRRPRLEAVGSDHFPARAVRPANTALDSSRFEAAYSFHCEAWQPAVERFVAAAFASAP